MINIYLDIFTKNPWLQALAWVVGICGALFALGVIARKLWRINQAITRTVNFVTVEIPQRFTAIDETLTAQNVKIEEIHHQTHENDGGSIKDGLKRVETQQKSMTVAQQKMLANQTRMERGIKGLYNRADDTDANAAELRKDLEDTRPVRPITRRPPKERST